MNAEERQISKLPMRILFKAGVLLLLVSLTVGCQDPVIERQRAEEKIAEAVLRKEIFDWYGSLEAGLTHPKDRVELDVARSLNFQTIYLSVHEKDPGDEFVSRFQDIGKSVKKYSASQAQTGRDRISGKQGILFTAGAVKWLTKDSVQVYGGYHCGGLCSAVYVHVVRCKGDRWTVETTRLVLIS